MHHLIMLLKEDVSTAEDFKVYTKQLYPNAQSIQVFGGEEWFI